MRKISKYQIFTELQHGPVTRVYKAIQPELQRVVLVKQLNPDLVTDDELVERFKQEGLILAKINSPQVITIYDFGFAEGVPFLVTEFIEGNTLAELIQQNGALPWDIGLFVVQQLAQGLAAIHNQNIIHQDIKPENIFISDDGKVKLGDLGFSVSTDQADQSIQGTPAYFAPEIIEGRLVDFRGDLYSLGLVGYEMLTGENPYAADDIPTIFNRIVNLKPMSVHAVRSEVPEKLSTIITRLMVRNRDERFQSAKELSQQLEDLKISIGIKIDENSLIKFLQEPDNYQISQAYPIEKARESIKKTTKRKRFVLPVAFITIGIFIILVVKIMSNGFSFLPGKIDTTRTTIEQNLSQLKSQNDIPVISKESDKEPELKTSKKNSDKSIMKNHVEKDTLKIISIVETKRDTVVITSDPRAFVFQQGDSLGITPLSLILDSPKNSLEIELRSPGFPTIRKTVTKAEQAVQNFHINLWKEVGYLDIDIIPWGEIWIDGDSVDVSPINRLIVLAPGNHRLMVRHPQMKNVTEPFYVAVGETVRKEIYFHQR